MVRLVSGSLLLAFSFILYTPGLWAQNLKPFQQHALDLVLAEVDEANRATVAAQYAPILANMNEAQVQMTLQALSASQEQANEAEVREQDELAEDYVVTAEDLEFNRAQYEPMVRKSWQAQKSFDDFVTSLVDQSCGKQGEFAVFGSGWRWELYPLSPGWVTASNSADLDVQIIGASYAQSDARYQYDFSAVKTSFDQQAVTAAVQTACTEYNKIGTAFITEARSKISNDELPGGFEMESAANLKVSPVRNKLDAELKVLSPSGDGALILALINGEAIH